MENLRVALADDHRFVLLGVRAALATHQDITIAGEATSPAALLDLLHRVPCDVLVTDLTMPGGTEPVEDGLALIHRIRLEWPALRVVVLTGLTHAAILRSVSASGVLGMLSKVEPMSDVIDAVRSANAGRAHISGSIRQILEESNAVPDQTACVRRLSPREQEVVGLFAQGQSISEIATTLRREVRTVRRQKRFAMTKLGVTNDPGLFARVRVVGKSDN